MEFFDNEWVLEAGETCEDVEAYFASFDPYNIYFNRHSVLLYLQNVQLSNITSQLRQISEEAVFFVLHLQSQVAMGVFTFEDEWYRSFQSERLQNILNKFLPYTRWANPSTLSQLQTLEIKLGIQQEAQPPSQELKEELPPLTSESSVDETTMFPSTVKLDQNVDVDVPATTLSTKGKELKNRISLEAGKSELVHLWACMVRAGWIKKVSRGKFGSHFLVWDEKKSVYKDSKLGSTDPGESLYKSSFLTGLHKQLHELIEKEREREKNY